MDEKEKMLKNLIYNPNYDIELFNERTNAKNKCFQYNNIEPSNYEKREKIIRDLLGKTCEKFLIEQPFVCDYGYNVEIGDNFYINHNSVLLDAGKIIFGDNVFIGPNCAFYTSGHPINVKDRNQGLEYAYPIKIGNNVWIGGNVVILPGVTVGDNTVIGAGSVVTKDIPESVIAFGNPCKVIKNIN